MPKRLRAAANLLKAKSAQLVDKKRRARRLSHLSPRGVAVFLLIVLIGSVGIFGFLSGAAAGRIADGVVAGPVVVGGLTPTEATALLTQRLADYRLKFQADTVEADFNPTAVLDGDGQALATVDVEAVVQRAFAVGRDKGPILAYLERTGAYLFGRDVGLPFQVNQEALDKELKVRFAGVFSPAVNAQIDASVGSDGQVETDIIPERPGTNLDTDRATDEAAERLKELSAGPVVIGVKHDQPKISKEEAEAAAAGVEAAVGRAPLTLTAKKSSWTVSSAQLASWLDAVAQDDGPAQLDFDQAAVKKYLESKAPEFAVAPVDAVFEQEEGKVTRLEPHVNGEQLDIDGSLEALRQAVFGQEPPGNETVELPIAVAEPELTIEEANPYGVKEIIGVGATNFSGSPKNRRSNIAVGAATLDGMVIPADAEFSLIKALGEIDGEHGYKQELVIKGNKTIPEYGGGLCQIGTTMFRTVLDAGLPVTERQNHSYRVSYYERDGDGNYIGPGKDATIYDPRPDFKFKNDTGYPIIIKTDIEGSTLTFTFWGVKDGRVAEQTDSTVWNITEPPEKQTIPSEELPPGEEKCTEHAHAGATAAFTYTVTYPDEHVEEKRFVSVYRPWGEVCLVGVDPNAEPLPEDSGSGTNISADAAGVQGD